MALYLVELENLPSEALKGLPPTVLQEVTPSVLNNLSLGQLEVPLPPDPKVLKVIMALVEKKREEGIRDEWIWRIQAGTTDVTPPRRGKRRFMVEKLESSDGGEVVVLEKRSIFERIGIQIDRLRGIKNQDNPNSKYNPRYRIIEKIAISSETPSPVIIGEDRANPSDLFDLNPPLIRRARRAVVYKNNSSGREILRTPITPEVGIPQPV